MGDLPSFFFFPSACCYVFMVNCQSLLPSQHIKLSSKSVYAFVCSHLPTHNRMTMLVTPIPHLIRYVVGNTLVALGDCLANFVPLKRTCDVAHPCRALLRAPCDVCQLNCSSELEYEWNSERGRQRKGGTCRFCLVAVQPVLLIRLSSSSAAPRL